MAWRIEYDPRAIDDLNRLSRGVRREIVQYLETRVAPADNPRLFGKPLRHGLAGLWRYRVRDYRSVCALRDEALIVLVVGVGHRREVYRQVRPHVPAVIRSPRFAYNRPPSRAANSYRLTWFPARPPRSPKPSIRQIEQPAPTVRTDVSLDHLTRSRPPKERATHATQPAARGILIPGRRPRHFRRSVSPDRARSTKRRHKHPTSTPRD